MKSWNHVLTFFSNMFGQSLTTFTDFFNFLSPHILTLILTLSHIFFLLFDDRWMSLLKFSKVYIQIFFIDCTVFVFPQAEQEKSMQKWRHWSKKVLKSLKNGLPWCWNYAISVLTELWLVQSPYFPWFNEYYHRYHL